MADGRFLEVEGLVVTYPGRRRGLETHAVQDVTFALERGETVGLVGESGSGKTSIGAAMVGLAPIAAGRVSLDGEDITRPSREKRRALTADVQVIFQDPYSSLNPSRTIEQTLEEPLLVHSDLARDARRARVRDLLGKVGLDPAAANRFPRAFSGGQRQRIAIARALIVSPRLVICDEPVSSLDLSVQAQVLNLLMELQRELSLSYLFISHDLVVVRHMSQRVVVLYQGRVMEAGPAETIYARPCHPYSQMLLTANPVPDPDEQRRRRLSRGSFGGGSSVQGSGSGCPFAARCPFVVERCVTTVPMALRGPTGTLVACHRRDEVVGSSGEVAAADNGTVRSVSGARE